MPNDLAAKIEAALETAFRQIDQTRQELVEHLTREASAHLDAAVGEARREAASSAGAQVAETLAASSRRIRSKESVTDIAIELVETAGQFCGRCALFIQKGSAILGFRAHGFSDPKVATALQQLEIPVASASGVAHAIGTRGVVVTGGSGAELSAEISELFGLKPDDRAHLVPVVLRDRVLALLYADSGGSGAAVQTAALEVLTTITEAWLEAVGTRKKHHEAVSAR
jgi:hypothetical protein